MSKKSRHQRPSHGRHASTATTGAPREFHVIDIENELGGSHFTSTDVAAFRVFYLSFANVAPDAQIVIATSSENGAIEAGLGWPGARVEFRTGRDGADLALIDVVRTENIAARFDRVIIASGDGIFAQVVTELVVQGVDVQVISRALSISSAFENAGEIVRLFGPIDFDESQPTLF